MKTIITIIIFLLICASVILIGCVKKDYSEYKKPGFNQAIIKVKSLNINEKTTFIEFKDELVEFKSFNDEFFPIWADHIDRISSILDDFNASTIFEEKAECSKILEQRYMEFEVNLENIKPPAIAEKAYNIAVEAVSYRVLFFKKFNENAPVKELNELEGKAYIAEAGFWDEIDRIYDYFDEEITRLNIGDDYKFVVLSN
jgi:hypothetical protein